MYGAFVWVRRAADGHAPTAARAADAKAAARALVVQEVGRGGYGHREVIVRVNCLATPWGRDDVAAVRAPPAQRRAGALSALPLRIAVQRPLHTSVSLLRDEILAPLRLKRDCDRAPGGLQRGRRGAAAESGERGAGVRRRSTRTLYVYFRTCSDSPYLHSKQACGRGNDCAARGAPMRVRSRSSSGSWPSTPRPPAWASGAWSRRRSEC